MTECDGTWVERTYPISEDPDDPRAVVLRCNGCGEKWVMLPKGRHQFTPYPATGFLSPNMTDTTAIRQAMDFNRAGAR